MLAVEIRAKCKQSKGRDFEKLLLIVNHKFPYVTLVYFSHFAIICTPEKHRGRVCSPDPE